MAIFNFNDDVMQAIIFSVRKCEYIFSPEIINSFKFSVNEKNTAEIVCACLKPECEEDDQFHCIKCGQVFFNSSGRLR